MRTIVIAMLCLLSAAGSYAQTTDTVIFKETGGTKLDMVVRYPEKRTSGELLPAFVFFPGGGWKNTGLNQFAMQAAYFTKRGMVTIVARYRTKVNHGTDPSASVADAKSAMRYIRTHAAELGIDPDRIVAGGGSAGGHLAAATAYIAAFDDPADDVSVSAAPSALVLWNPVIDNSENGYGYDRVSEYWKEFSPMHNITPEKAVPTLVLSGKKDTTVTPATLKEFQQRTRNAGSRCRLVLYDDAGHGFFNYSRKEESGPNFYLQTVQEAERFLISEGYIKPRGKK